MVLLGSNAQLTTVPYTVVDKVNGFINFFTAIYRSLHKHTHAHNHITTTHTTY